MKQVIRTALAVAAISSMPLAMAADDIVKFKIEGGIATGKASTRDQIRDDIKLYFGKQKTPAVEKSIGQWTANRKTNATNKTDKEACEIAFVSAIVSLQQRARREGGDAVINIASVDGIRPDHGLGIYSASKAALINLTKAMALEWGTHNVRANAVCPGLIKTDFSAAMWNADEGVGAQLARQPLPRLGTPEDVAGLVLFLASDAGRYCTGGVYLVDGGWMA